MKTLYLLRHAKSSWDDPAIQDFQRPLADPGRQAAPRIGKYMKKQKLIPNAVLCSGARRAVETWELIAPSFDEPKVQIDDTLYMASPDAMLSWLRRLPADLGAVLMIGHNPGFEELAHRLCSNGKKKAIKQMRKKFPAGALAVITFETDDWAQVGDGSGFLDRFVRPKDL
jgi:phosphohistidine phosphatase